ncbi:MAG TPA: response regulator transcription factor [Herpetosiphonaceae bacterium]|nr:response regulator transcription factor [Herpetosiphonaceae bacterium]
MGIKILVVDDEPQIQHLLHMALTRRGYEVSSAAHGEVALDLAATTQPDLMVLDLSLPTMDGLEVCRRIRTWSRMPIVVLSAREGYRDKVEALDLGADDYVTKPFSTEELLARLRVALRHVAPATDLPPIRQYGDLTVDLNRRLIIRAGMEVHLTPTEYDLLRLFITHADRPLTQAQILREVWGSGYEKETATLRVFIAQLRQKIEPEPSRPRLIVTETGVGYRFRTNGSM